MAGRIFVLAALLAAITPAVAAGPQRTSAVFDDWTVICSFPGDKPKQCEIVSIQTMPGQNNPFGQISINHPDKNAAYKLTVQTPPNAWLPTGVKLMFDEKDDGAAATFKWCAGTRCLADGDVSKAVMKKIIARSLPGSFTFKDSAQNDISVPVSFKGFTQAMEAMDSQ